MRFFEWVRRNSEHYLLEAAQREMAKKYLGAAPDWPAKETPAELFFRRVYVPVYRLLPWSLRRSIIRAMPGSHRRQWGSSTR